MELEREMGENPKQSHPFMAHEFSVTIRRLAHSQRPFGNWTTRSSSQTTITHHSPRYSNNQTSQKE